MRETERKRNGKSKNSAGAKYGERLWTYFLRMTRIKNPRSSGGMLGSGEGSQDDRGVVVVLTAGPFFF